MNYSPTNIQQSKKIHKTPKIRINQFPKNYARLLKQQHLPSLQKILSFPRKTIHRKIRKYQR